MSLLGGAITATAWDPWLFALGAPIGVACFLFAINLATRPIHAGVVTALFTFTWLALACMWMAVFGPIAFIALFISQSLAMIPFGLLAWWWRRDPWRFVTIPMAYVATEVLRTTIPLGGFAWAQLSHSQAGAVGLAHLYPLVGSWGMSALIMALSLILAFVVHGLIGLDPSPPGHRRGRQVNYAMGVIAAVVCAAMLPPFTTTTEDDAPLLVRIVQAGDVRHTFAAGISALEPRNETVVDKVLHTQSLASVEGADLIVWPENSLDNDPDLPSQHRLAAKRDTLLSQTGEATVFAGQNSHTPAGGLTNVIGVYRDGRMVDTIAKAKLVPFGEFFPYPDLLGWLPSAQLIGHMVPGDGPTSVPLGQRRVGAVICYESAYEQMATQAVDDATGVLVVSTNNASFADTAMKDQHLRISRQRALEYGRPVVHGSLSGPSAFISPDGTIHDTTEYLESTVISKHIQPRSGWTIGMKVNTVLPPVAFILVALAIGLTILRRRHP